MIWTILFSLIIVIAIVGNAIVLWIILGKYSLVAQILFGDFSQVTEHWFPSLSPHLCLIINEYDYVKDTTQSTLENMLEEMKSIDLKGFYFKKRKNPQFP